DLAKHVFQVHGVDAEGATVLRKQLRRAQVLAFFGRLPPCLVGLRRARRRTTGPGGCRPLGTGGGRRQRQTGRRTSSRTSPVATMRKRFARLLGARRCALCRSRRPTSKLPCCCTVAGSGWCASVRVW